MLIVGAGRRVQNNFLPVLRFLNAQFKVVGIFSRSPSKLQGVADRWGVPAVHSLSRVDMQGVDIVAISVPTSQNAVVLRALLPHAARLRVVIDTPIANNRTELRAVRQLLVQFAGVTVTEDYMNFPSFALVREAVTQGFIGRPVALTLNNTGYLYHGLALIRSFVNFRPVVRSWRHAVGGLTTIVGFQFSGGFQACVVGPYRSHTAGGMTLEGSVGIITEFPIDIKKASGKHPAYLLSLLYTNGLLTGCGIEGDNRCLKIEPPELVAMQGMPFEDKSELNLLRGCGLATVLRSLTEQDELNATYGAKNALYDSFISGLAQQGRLPIDPLTWIGGDAMMLVHALSCLRG